MQQLENAVKGLALRNDRFLSKDVLQTLCAVFILGLGIPNC